jgi:AcrR family transcriptional regulator
MHAHPKLSSEERRAAIIKAVRRVFADKGFYGTTTRELADAAGVSEALLFKHFPNKEALYSAMQISCCSEQGSGKWERLKALEPSTSTLVLMVHMLVNKMLAERPRNGDDDALMHRLMLHSLMEDGEFARLFLMKRLASCWIPKVEECVKASVAAGDMERGPGRADLAGWFVHHLAAMLMVNLFPGTPVVDYGVGRDKLVEQVVWFALRGLGLTNAVIRRHYNPKALALLSD